MYCSGLITQEPLKDGVVLYEEHVLHFDDSRKWRERYVVVRANYSLECHESYEVLVMRNLYS